MRTKTLLFAILMACAALAVPALLPADPVAVRYAEGLVHGFLTLRTLDGTLVANGDLIQIARGDQVTTQLVFHFKDGSLYDETAIFSQRGHFRLVSNHLVQKGSTFPQPLDMTINTGNGLVTVHYKGDDGKEKVENEKLDLPADLANGMMMVLLKNVDARNLPPTVSYVAATPKPRLVKMAISAAARTRFPWRVPAAAPHTTSSKCRSAASRASLRPWSASNRPTTTCGFSRVRRRHS